MSQSNGKDFYAQRPGFMTLSFYANKLKVLIVGGGKAGLIKAKTFLKNGCSLWVVSLDFIEGFKGLEREDHISFIRDSYNIEYIKDKHIVVIATDDCRVNEKIMDDCEAFGKIYLACQKGEEGLFFTPVQRETKSVNFSIHTLYKSPKSSLFLADILNKEIIKYDGFIEYLCSLRESIRGKGFKNKVMDFVNTQDFYDFYCMGVHERVLKMFYGGEIFEAKDRNSQE